jgi:hypothetical protein
VEIRIIAQIEYIQAQIEYEKYIIPNEYQAILSCVEALGIGVV